VSSSPRDAPALDGRDRLNGILLFLPVPLVLFLFTRQPLGPGPSLGIGVAIMLTHRLYARPFALARAARRCLWCGALAGEGPGVKLDEPLGSTSWRACGQSHADLVSRTLGWAAERSLRLRLGILGTLALFLGLSLAAVLGRPPALEAGDAVAVFRLGVALTVLPLGWLAPLTGPAAGPRGRLPFPVHVQALVGTLWVLWLFRLVGLWWLVAGLLHLARRVA
jgi:hypothetical protein